MPRSAPILVFVGLLYDRNNFWNVFDALHIGMVFQRKKPRREIAMLDWREILIAEVDHEMVKPCLMNVVERLV